MAIGRYTPEPSTLWRRAAAMSERHLDIDTT
jgi:hypothetical protein